MFVGPDERPFRLAIAGSGQITSQSHLPAALASPASDVVALFYPVVDRASELTRRYGLEIQVARRLVELTTEIEGVVIATPTHTHCGLALEFVSAGVHAIIEKPLAMSQDEGSTILEAASRSGVTVSLV